MPKPAVSIREVRWSEIERQIVPMFRRHWEELGSVGKFDPDTDTFRRGSQQGLIKITAALRGPVLLAYCFWFLSSSLEDRELAIAQQGPWYCRGGAPSSLGRRVFKASLGMLRDCGVREAYPHFRPGPGSVALGWWIERQGAKLLEISYRLPLEAR